MPFGYLTLSEVAKMNFHVLSLGTYRCSDQKVEGSRRMYVRYQQDVSPSRRCAEYVRVPSTSPTSSPDALMTRESLLGEFSAFYLLAYSLASNRLSRCTMLKHPIHSLAPYLI